MQFLSKQATITMRKQSVWPNNFAGTNNLDLLVTTGHFGTRAYGGKYVAATQYLFTMLNLLPTGFMHLVDAPI